MATKNIVPRDDGEGNIGTAAKNWLKGFFKTIFLGTGGIVDSNSNEVLKPDSVADAVNEITIKNAVTGDPPEIQSTGDDTDIDIALIPKGNGVVKNQDGEIVSEAASLTSGKLVKVNGDRIIEDATNTDTEVSDAVTKKHSQNTDTGSNSDPFILTGKLKKSVQAGVTAYAGGGQANAIQITKDFVEISTCAASGDSVKLPEASPGLMIIITNHGENSCDVFPNTDDAINEASPNTAKSLGVNATMLCYAYDETNWECLTLSR